MSGHFDIYIKWPLYKIWSIYIPPSKLSKQSEKFIFSTFTNPTIILLVQQTWYVCVCVYITEKYFVIIVIMCSLVSKSVLETRKQYKQIKYS